MENPIKMDDLGVPAFSETSISLQCWFDGDFTTQNQKSPTEHVLSKSNHNSQHSGESTRKFLNVKGDLFHQISWTCLTAGMPSEKPQRKS